MPAPPIVHIVEPTLTSAAGHCLSLVRSLASAAPDAQLTVWAGEGSAGLGPWGSHTRVRPFFRRRWRRAQSWWLYRRLLRQPGRILVATAGTADLVLADWAAAGSIPPSKFFCFVHWMSARPDKARRLESLARRQPGIEILAPTASVTEFFRECGFRATAVPYPMDLDGADAPTVHGGPATFKHLLVPGSARLDKGIDRVADLVEELQRHRSPWPIVVQTAVEPRHVDDLALARELDRLQRIAHAPLMLCPDTPDSTAYRTLFEGAVVLQPYRAEVFRDRVSGVTLDALAAGAPVVVTDGTWMARLVQRFDAGVVVADTGPAALMAAVDRILGDFPRYVERAREAATAVRAEHSARALMDVVLQPV